MYQPPLNLLYLTFPYFITGEAAGGISSGGPWILVAVKCKRNVNAL
jgi:hypothetical protein